MTVAQFKIQVMSAGCGPIVAQIDLDDTDNLLNFADREWEISHPTGNQVRIVYTRVITKRGNRNEPLDGYFDVMAIF